VIFLLDGTNGRFVTSEYVVDCGSERDFKVLIFIIGWHVICGMLCRAGIGICKVAIQF